MMRMDAALGLRFEHAIEGLQSRSDAIHRHRPAAIRDVHAVCAIALHQRSLCGKRGGVNHVTHQEEAGDVATQTAGLLAMLPRSVGSGAVGCDPPRVIADRAPSWKGE